MRFQSPHSPVLLTASEDGLACIFDTSKPSEEAALDSVLNVQTPLRQVGFFGPSFEGVYCLTGSETLSVWHYESAQRICDYGTDVRRKLSTLAGEADIDYLVDCQWDTSRQELSLLAGNHTGDAYMYRVDAGALSLSYSLKGGHRGDVRSWCLLTNNSLFVTVGEDARLCEWNRSEGQLETPRGETVVNQACAEIVIAISRWWSLETTKEQHDKGRTILNSTIHSDTSRCICKPHSGTAMGELFNDFTRSPHNNVCQSRTRPRPMHCLCKQVGRNAAQHKSDST